MSEASYPLGDDPTPDELLLRTLCAERSAAVLRRGEAEARIVALDERIAEVAARVSARVAT